MVLVLDDFWKVRSGIQFPMGVTIVFIYKERKKKMFLCNYSPNHVILSLFAFAQLHIVHAQSTPYILRRFLGKKKK